MSASNPSTALKPARRLKVLLIVEQCNPDEVSVPLVGYSFYQAIAQRADVTLVTHERNRMSLEKRHFDQDIAYISESLWLQRYYWMIARLSCFRGQVIWPLRLALAYPIYHSFNRQVYARFSLRIKRGDYDVRTNAHVSSYCTSGAFPLSHHLQQILVIPSGFESLGVSAALR